MPDLDMVTYAHCSSVDGWEQKVRGSKGNEYIVRWEPMGGTHQYDFTCTCPHYTHRRVECKHIQSVKDEHCGWMQFIHGDKPVERSVALENGETVDVRECPRCGSGINYMRWGV